MKNLILCILYFLFSSKLYALSFEPVAASQKNCIQQFVDSFVRVKYNVSIIDKDDYAQTVSFLQLLHVKYPYQLKNTHILIGDCSKMIVSTTAVIIPRCWLLELEQGDQSRLEEIEFMMLNLSLDLKRRSCEKRFVEFATMFALLSTAVIVYVVKNPDCIKECIQDSLMMGYQHYKK